MLNHVDLFSGIGGFALGLEATGGFKTQAFCEIDPFCHQVLKKHWPDVPIHNDVRNFEYDGTIHILTGGYPCQPESTAGKRKGESDPRYLWPAMRGIIERKRPRWVIGENVAGHISMGLDNVLADLERAAYTAIPFVIPACAVGAPHRRDRVWIIATDSAQMQCDGGDDHTRISARAESLSEFGNGGWQGIMADTTGIRQQGSWQFEKRRGDSQEREGQATDAFTSCIGNFWQAEPAVGRVVNGLSKGLDSVRRLTALGNAVVPQIPYMIGKFILKVEESLLTPSL